jgi:carboxymethylenebutenolidase
MDVGSIAMRSSFAALFMAGLMSAHSGPAGAAGATPAAAARDPRLPPSEDAARAALDTSPRHGEYVEIRLPGGGSTLRACVVFPERRDKAGVVLIVHEIYGLSDWIRGVADQLAREGFIAIAPDLLSGFGPGGGGTESVASRDSVVQMIRLLSDRETEARLDAAREYATHLTASNGKLATLGFCWGGGKSFAYAGADPPPDAAVVFYGVAPDSAGLSRVRAPVLAHYGGDDARVTSTVAPAQAALRGLGRSYEPHVYPGAGHGFLRAQDLRDGANLKATREAWPRTLAFLRRYLK